MILTDYYKSEKLTEAKCRFDITSSTMSYDYFENLLINKRGFNAGGHSIYCVSRPDRWKTSKTSLALTKGTSNITSIKRPNLEINIAYGDINGSNDGCIIVFNDDFKTAGICVIEIYIARGLRNDTNGLWNYFVDGELDYEVEYLKDIANNYSISK